MRSSIVRLLERTKGGSELHSRIVRPPPPRRTFAEPQPPTPRPESGMRFERQRRRAEEAEDELLFGLWSTKAALLANRRTVHKIFLQRRGDEEGDPDLMGELEVLRELAAKRKIPLELTSRRELSYMTNDRPHQGIVMRVSELRLPGVLSLTAATEETSRGG